MTMKNNCEIGSSDKPTIEVSNFLLLLPRVLATTSGFAFYSIFFHFIRYSFICVNVALRFHLFETAGGQTLNLSKNLHDPIFGQQNFTH